jgi:hypothetical protein
LGTKASIDYSKNNTIKVRNKVDDTWKVMRCFTYFLAEKTWPPYPTIAVRTLGPKSRAGLSAKPVLEGETPFHKR